MNPIGGPDLFGIAVYGDPGAPETNIIHIEQAGLGLPDEAYYREDHYAPIREAYVKMVAKQLTNAKLVEADDEAESQARRSLKSRRQSPRTTGTMSPPVIRRRPITPPVMPS